MNRFASIFIALGLATAGSTALAEQAKDQVSAKTVKPQPVQMTDAQLDNVAAGLIPITVVVVDVVDVTNNKVAVPIQVGANVNAAAVVLGGVATATQNAANTGRSVVTQ